MVLVGKHQDQKSKFGMKSFCMKWIGVVECSEKWVVQVILFFYCKDWKKACDMHMCLLMPTHVKLLLALTCVLFWFEIGTRKNVDRSVMTSNVIFGICKMGNGNDETKRTLDGEHSLSDVWLRMEQNHFR